MTIRTVAYSSIQRTLDELREVPGVESATLTCGPCLPLMIGLTMSWDFEDFPPRGGGGPRSRWVAATDEYFQVFGIRVVAGRTFDSGDRAGTAPVVVINQEMRATFSSGHDPIGRRLVIGNQPPSEIIGVVDDIPDGDLRRPVTPRMYVPIAQLAEEAAFDLLATSNWAVRTSGNPYRYSQSVARIVLNTMGVPVSQVESGEDYVKRSLGSQRFNLLLMSVFAAAAVLLASVGVFGMIAYTVERRLAGADPGHSTLRGPTARLGRVLPRTGSRPAGGAAGLLGAGRPRQPHRAVAGVAIRVAGLTREDRSSRCRKPAQPSTDGSLRARGAGVVMARGTAASRRRRPAGRWPARYGRGEDRPHLGRTKDLLVPDHHRGTAANARGRSRPRPVPGAR
jgi:hypothetical protein